MSDPTLFDYSMIKGTVDAILFQNNDNFYTVIKVETIETNMNHLVIYQQLWGSFQILWKEMYTLLKDKW